MRQLKILIGAGCLHLLFLWPLSSSCATVVSPTVDVRQRGAKGDGKTLDSAALQAALDECGRAGGGTVRLTKGVYLSQPLFLRTGVTLQLDKDATLLATDERSDFVTGDKGGNGSGSSFVAFINGKNLKHISISGQGTIDGSGARWWGPAREAKKQRTDIPGYTLPRPRLILLSGCSNVRIVGITLQNSPSFHLVPTDCEDVVIENVKILAPDDAPNTDGIDPSVSRRVRIAKCYIDVGDDNVALKSGKRVPGREFACEDISVTDCVFVHGHGVSIGSESVGGVRNLRVERCRFEGTENGIRIKSPRGRGGVVENVFYRDITMTNVDRAITITGYYPKIPKTDEAQPLTAETPVFRNIEIQNLTATSRSSAGMIIGLPESTVSGLVLRNVRVSAATTGLEVRNAKDVRFEKVRVEAAKGPAITKANAEVRELDVAVVEAPDTSAQEWALVPAILNRIKAPAFPPRDFSIKDFGAFAGGKVDCTASLRQAVDACARAGGGRVIVPAGEYLTGPIHLKSNVELHLEQGATLRFTTNSQAFLPAVLTRFEGIECYNYSPLVYAFGQENVAITGQGTLDGQASDQTWWAWKGKKQVEPGVPNQKAARERLGAMAEQGVPVSARRFGEGDYFRPAFVEFYRCRNVLIEGVRVRRSPMWELHPTLCTNVIVRGVDILSHGPNNDGCDPESCRDVLIEDCVFDTGDDCIAIKSGRNNDGRRVGAPSENVVIRRCTMKDGHGGVVIGSEISGGCRNVFAEDCRMDSPNLERVLRLKSNAVRGGVIENIFMRNVTVGRVADAVLQIDFVYEEGAKGPHKPVARNVVMERVAVEDTPRVLNVVGFPGAEISGIRLYDCAFKQVKGPDVVKEADVKRINCRVGQPRSHGGAASYLPRGADWFGGKEGREIAANILSRQSIEGSWPKNLDTTRELFRGDRSEIRGTFDNGATTDELRFLAAAFRATQDERCRDAVLKGVDHILKAQYPSGGWPQYYPPSRQYHRHVSPAAVIPIESGAGKPAS